MAACNGFVSEPLPPVDKSYVDFAESLADAAGKVIMQYWRLPIDVISKHEPGRSIAQVESPVTVADRLAETEMRNLIEARFPTHGIHGEEHGPVRMDAEYVWVLDPIDGTKSFITGKPLFGTLIALLHKGVPVCGIIDQCVLKERWVGANGVTRLNGKPVTSKGVDKLSEAMVYATTPHMFAEGLEEDRFVCLRDSVKRALYGCDCYAYALVASGFGADLVVEADLGIYDYCALVPVVKCAGGRMSDWNGQELTLKPGAAEVSKGRVIAAANQAIWEQGLECLRDGGRAKPASSRKQAPASFLIGAACGAALAWLALRKRS